MFKCDQDTPIVVVTNIWTQKQHVVILDERINPFGKMEVMKCWCSSSNSGCYARSILRRPDKTKIYNSNSDRQYINVKTMEKNVKGRKGLNTVEKRVEHYFGLNGVYPPDLEDYYDTFGRKKNCPSYAMTPHLKFLIQMLTVVEDEYGLFMCIDGEGVGNAWQLGMAAVDMDPDMCGVFDRDDAEEVPTTPMDDITSDLMESFR